MVFFEVSRFLRVMITVLVFLLNLASFGNFILGLLGRSIFHLGSLSTSDFKNKICLNLFSCSEGSKQIVFVGFVVFHLFLFGFYGFLMGYYCECGFKKCITPQKPWLLCGFSVFLRLGPLGIS